MPTNDRLPTLCDVEPILPIDIARLIETRLLVQANSGGGKSWALRRLLEVTYGHVQHLVLDPDGEYHTLRQKFDYVLAGKGGDCPAEVKSAKLLARRLLELGASAIIDISELGEDRAAFVEAFLESLMDAPRQLWHPVMVVIDEAHKFCSEGDRKATAHAAVVDLMSRGRKRGFCGVLATQRISKLDKSAAAEVNNKLIGRTGLDVDVDRAAKEIGLNLKDARAELPYLEPGQFWAVGPALAARPTLVKIGQVATTHPKAGARGGPPTPPRGDFKKALAEQLANLPAEAEAEAKTVEELRKRVRELEATGGGAEVERLEKMVQVLVQERDIARAKLEDIERVELANDGLLEEVSRGIDESIDRLTALRNRIPEALEEAAKTSNGSRVFFGAVPPPDIPQPRRVEVRSSDGEVAWVDPKKLTISQGADLSAMERAFLTVLAQWRETYTSAMPKHKVLLYADYSAGGATSKCFAKMTKAGWIAPDGAGSVRITSSGLGALGSYEPLPTGEDLYRHILNGSRLSTMEKELLSRIWEVRREGAIGKGEVLKRAGYAAGGATSKAFARLVALDYCVNTGGGKICVADDLWKRRDV